MVELDGKVALVTGGGRGIGRAIVDRLAASGAIVVINDVDPEPAHEAVREIQRQGGQALAYPGNISDRAFGDDFIAAALSKFGRLDIVVNNAGYATYSYAQDTTDRDFDEVLDVLVSAPFRILRAAGRYFRDEAQRCEPGRAPIRKVVNISSVGGIAGAPNQVAYGVGKAAIIGLTNTLALEWGKFNVNVNAVAPGLTRTRLTEGPDVGVTSITIDGREHQLTSGAWPPESRVPLDQLAAMVPLGRIGTPDELARVVHMLSSSASDYISGQTIIVDGGLRTGR